MKKILFFSLICILIFMKAKTGDTPSFDVTKLPLINPNSEESFGFHGDSTSFDATGRYVLVGSSRPGAYKAYLIDTQTDAVVNSVDNTAVGGVGNFGKAVLNNLIVDGSGNITGGYIVVVGTYWIGVFDHNFVFKSSLSVGSILRPGGGASNFQDRIKGHGNYFFIDNRDGDIHRYKVDAAFSLTLDHVISHAYTSYDNLPNFDIYDSKYLMVPNHYDGVTRLIIYDNILTTPIVLSDEAFPYVENFNTLGHRIGGYVTRTIAASRRANVLTPDTYIEVSFDEVNMVSFAVGGGGTRTLIASAASPDYFLPQDTVVSNDRISVVTYLSNGSKKTTIYCYDNVSSSWKEKVVLNNAAYPAHFGSNTDVVYFDAFNSTHGIGLYKANLNPTLTILNEPSVTLQVDGAVESMPFTGNVSIDTGLPIEVILPIDKNFSCWELSDQTCYSLNGTSLGNPAIIYLIQDTIITPKVIDKDKFTVKIELINGDELKSDISVTNGGNSSVVALPFSGVYYEIDQVQIASNNNHIHFQFTHWLLNGVVNNSNPISVDINTAPGIPVILNPIYLEDPKYTISVSELGGTADIVGRPSKTEVFYENETVTIVATTTLDHHHFVGWKKTDNSIYKFLENESFLLTENLNLVATYQEDNKYTIVISGQNGSAKFADNSTGAKIFYFDDQVILTADTPDTGYAFIGWYEVVGEQAVFYSSSEIQSFMPERDITLVARYAKKGDDAFFNFNDYAWNEFVNNASSFGNSGSLGVGGANELMMVNTGEVSTKVLIVSTPESGSSIRILEDAPLDVLMLFDNEILWGSKFLMEVGFIKGKEVSGALKLVRANNAVYWDLNSNGSLTLTLNGQSGTDTLVFTTESGFVSNAEWQNLQVVVDLSQTGLENIVQIYKDGILATIDSGASSVTGTFLNASASLGSSLSAYFFERTAAFSVDVDFVKITANIESNIDPGLFYEGEKNPDIFDAASVSLYIPSGVLKRVKNSKISQENGDQIEYDISAPGSPENVFFGVFEINYGLEFKHFNLGSVFIVDFFIQKPYRDINGDLQYGLWKKIGETFVDSSEFRDAGDPLKPNHPGVWLKKYYWDSRDTSFDWNVDDAKAYVSSDPVRLKFEIR